MFVVRASVLLDLLASYQPELARGLRALAAEPERLEELWPSLTKIAIDHAVAEPAAADGRVAVVPGDFGWDDVGDFSSLGSLIADDEELPGVKILGSRDQVVVNEASGSGRTRLGPHGRRPRPGRRRRGRHPGRGAGHDPGPRAGGEGPRGRPEEQRPRRPDLTPATSGRPRRRVLAPFRGNGWVVCWSCGPLLPHRRPQRDRRRAGAGAGGGTAGPARPSRALADGGPHHHAGRPPPGRGRHPRPPAAGHGPRRRPRAARRGVPRGAARGPRRAPGAGPLGPCPGPRSTTASATPAATTSTPPRSSGPARAARPRGGAG